MSALKHRSYWLEMFFFQLSKRELFKSNFLESLIFFVDFKLFGGAIVLLPNFRPTTDIFSVS